MISEQYVRTVAGTMNGPPLAYEFCAKHGRAMELGPHPLNNTMPRGMCYSNAVSMVLFDTPRLAYCEGWAVCGDIGFPLNHAWVLDRETGLVIDPTEKDWHSHFGVTFNFRGLNAIYKRTRHHGVFDNLFLLRMPTDRVWRLLLTCLDS